DPQPAVEYRAVCRNLPANAHWTDGSTREEIPQTESSPNVREPSPVGTYGTSTGDTACHFICDDGYGWNGTSCNVVKVRAACETQEIEFSGFKIAKCNVGATVAGTGKLDGQDECVTAGNGTTCWSESIGDYFQRGNNYGFANSGTLATTSTQSDTSGY
ncbi:MAG: hypothetical protein LBG59_01105, partial [Candidatus Peribacteria bacterium]|nr:hypothetical protein [Candidatus Peribacteria bacterium]